MSAPSKPDPLGLPPGVAAIIAGQLAREARTHAAVERARAKGALVPCPRCGTEKWHDNACFGCIRAAEKREEGAGR